MCDVVPLSLMQRSGDDNALDCAVHAATPHRSTLPRPAAPGFTVLTEHEPGDVI